MKPLEKPKQIFDISDIDNARKTLLEISATLKKILKVKQIIKWNKGEAKANVEQDFRLSKLNHIDLSKREQSIFDLICKKLKTTEEFLGWSLHSKGWQENLNEAELFKKRLKILKVSLSLIFDIIETIEPISDKLYHFGSDFENGQPSQYQKSFDVYLWNQVEEILKSLKNNRHCSNDPELINILDLNLKSNLSQEVKATIFNWESVNGFRVRRVDTSPTFLRSQGNLYSLVIRVKSGSQTNLAQFGMPVMTTIKITPLEDNAILVGTGIKNLAIVINSEIDQSKYVTKSFSVIADNKYLDDDLRLEGKSIFLNVGNELKEISKPLLTQLFSDIVLEALKGTTGTELKFLTRTIGNMSVLSMTLSPKLKQTMKSFKSSQVPVCRELIKSNKVTQQNRAQRNRQYGKPRKN